ncbi:hypothetical protein PI125_g2337 [Phytophthora idaei]|nr:hypothetical protein PI125_g2337 [Phytophthora idaei]
MEQPQPNRNKSEARQLLFGTRPFLLLSRYGNTSRNVSLEIVTLVAVVMIRVFDSTLLSNRSVSTQMSSKLSENNLQYVSTTSGPRMEQSMTSDVMDLRRKLNANVCRASGGLLKRGGKVESMPSQRPKRSGDTKYR